MANDKGKGRRVEGSDDEEEHVPGSTMDTDDGEEESTSRSKKDKGKGRATSSTAPARSNGRQSNAKAGSQENGVSDQENEDDEEEEKAAGETNGAADDKNDEPDLNKKQDINEKRSIRKNYRDLTNTLIADRARDPDGMTTAMLKEGLDKVNRLFKDVHAPSEAVLDSTFLQLTSEMAMHQARKLKVGTDYFDTEDFLTKLRSAITGGVVRRTGTNATPRRGTQARQRGQRAASEADNEEQEAPVQDPYVGWDRIGKLATKHCLRVPPIDFMLGPLAIPQKKKIQKKKQAREKAAVVEKVRPQEIGEDDVQHDEHALPTLVKKVADILEEVGDLEGINLFKFIINPESYNQTVENIFYLSFLVKERKASIDYDDDGEPVIHEEQMKEGDVKPRQLIFEMDLQTWKDAIEAYDITETIIPTRKYQGVGAGKWYG